MNNTKQSKTDKSLSNRKMADKSQLRATQYRVGHRYITSTGAYLQCEVEGLKEEVEQFHPLG